MPSSMMALCCTSSMRMLASDMRETTREGGGDAEGTKVRYEGTKVRYE